MNEPIGKIRSLPISDWPANDRIAWELACQPGERLRRGGTASHLKTITREDLARRYGYFLDFLARHNLLDLAADAGAHVTPPNVSDFIAELKARVGSVTLYASIYKLRRATALIAPHLDLSWLRDAESDLELMMQPRSKLHRLVLAETLVEAGLTLMAEADMAAHLSPLHRARQFRNGLMIALLACCPIRLKNFAALEIGRSFVQSGDDWWIVLAPTQTKEARADERRVPTFLSANIAAYISLHRPQLGRGSELPSAMWLSSNDGTAMSYSAVERVISITTEAAVGVNVSPHLFRTAAATTAATHGTDTPRLASALLQHRDPAITEAHYNRASSLSASAIFSDVVNAIRIL